MLLFMSSGLHGAAQSHPGDLPDSVLRPGATPWQLLLQPHWPSRLRPLLPPGQPAHPRRLCLLLPHYHGAHVLLRIRVPGEQAETEARCRRQPSRGGPGNLPPEGRAYSLSNLSRPYKDSWWE